MVRAALRRAISVTPSRKVGTRRTSVVENFIVRGPAGAVHFALALNWYVGEPATQMKNDYPPRGITLSVHSTTARPGFPLAGIPRCEWLGAGAACWTANLPELVAEDLAQGMLYRGDVAIWEELERLYRSRLS